MRPLLECTGVPAFWATVCLGLQCLVAAGAEPLRLGPGVSEFSSPVGSVVKAETIYTLPDGRKVVVQETSERAAAAVPCEVRANVPTAPVAAPCQKCLSKAGGCDCVGGCPCEARAAAERDSVQPRPGRVAGADTRPVETSAIRTDRLMGLRVQTAYSDGTVRVVSVRQYVADGGDVRNLKAVPGAISDDDLAFIKSSVPPPATAVAAPPIIPPTEIPAYSYSPVYTSPPGYTAMPAYMPVPAYAGGACANGQCAAPAGQPARGMSMSLTGPFGGGFRFGAGGGATACAGGR